MQNAILITGKQTSVAPPDVEQHQRDEGDQREARDHHRKWKVHVGGQIRMPCLRKERPQVDLKSTGKQQAPSPSHIRFPFQEPFDHASEVLARC